jgi:uncharacterized LabA/DUF88 family protein
MKAAFGRRYHWLDLEQLAGDMKLPDESVVGVKYFTARVRNDPAAEHRQDVYLQALRVHCSNVQIFEGRFQRKTMRCRSCSARWTTYEEKESDVNLAVSLVEDTANDAYDSAVLVSADSDLCPAIRAAHRVWPGKPLIAALPPNRSSPDLERRVSGVLHIDRAMLSRAQLPIKVVTPNGIELTRPAYWS